MLIVLQWISVMESNVALQLLDTCMKHCGVGFHAEVGKFCFLNEMIKLVSPKHLGGQTALAVKQWVLLLMHTWMVDYPREAKNKEAYNMLKKQGVIKVCCEDVRYLRTALFWVIMQQVMVILYGHWRTTCRSHPYGSRIQKKACILNTEYTMFTGKSVSSENHHSGMLHYFIWYIRFNVWKGCGACVLDCLTLRMMALWSFKTSGNTVKARLSSAGWSRKLF